MSIRDQLLLSIADELDRSANLTEDVGANVAAAMDFTPENLDKLQSIDVSAQTQRIIAMLLRDLIQSPPERCLERIGMETLRRRLVAGLGAVMVEGAA